MPAPTLDPDVSTSIAIKQILTSRLGKQWGVGDRLPPVKELAKQLGTGQSNTHLAVKSLVRDGLLVSRRRRGTFVADVPKGTSLQDQVIVLRYSARQFHQRMAKAFADEIEHTGATVQHEVSSELAMVDIGIDEAADAVVYFNPPAAEPIRCRPNQFLSIVTTTRFVSVPDHARHDLVGVDEHQGGVLAGRMLRETGCKRPCFIGRHLDSDPSRFDATSSVRLNGFEEGWGEVLPGDRLIKAEAYNPVAGGYAFRSVLDMPDRPDGIFAASDEIAYGVLIAAGSHGLSPAKDYQLVGFDGQGRSDEFGGIKLSTVKVPCEQIGRRAARLLIERFSNPDRPIDRLSYECLAHHGQTTRQP